MNSGKMENNLRTTSIFWFRRDLRLHDNAGLYHALKAGRSVLPVFIFDRDILDRLEDKTDRRVEFIHLALEALQRELVAMGSTLLVLQGRPDEVWAELLQTYNVDAVYTNHDYEPQAIARDERVAGLLREKGVAFHTFKDQVIFEKDEVVKDDGKPYTIYTPYKNKWRAKLDAYYLRSYPTEKYVDRFIRMPALEMPSFGQLGFKAAGLKFPSTALPPALVKQYAAQRDMPGIAGTSQLGVHLRFGTVSVRELVREALPLSDTWVNELVWREFFMMILWHFPHVEKGAFKREYDRISWRNNEAEFQRWCEGKTGYPIVDAGMRELNATGFMHNRVRMITASFLIKHLLIDWRWGEAYFAQKLLDFDLSANNGNWQWAASSGCDAAPYFRIFSPDAQTAKFDPEGVYINKWVPELNSFDYPQPVVDHKAARERCLEAYKKALGR